MKYRTYMNNLAILPYFTLHTLQLLNIKQKTCKKIDVGATEINDNSVSEVEEKEIKTEIE